MKNCPFCDRNRLVLYRHSPLELCSFQLQSPVYKRIVYWHIRTRWNLLLPAPILECLWSPLLGNKTRSRYLKVVTIKDLRRQSGDTLNRCSQVTLSVRVTALQVVENAGNSRLHFVGDLGDRSVSACRQFSAETWVQNRQPPGYFYNNNSDIMFVYYFRHGRTQAKPYSIFCWPKCILFDSLTIEDLSSLLTFFLSEACRHITGLVPKFFNLVHNDFNRI